MSYDVISINANGRFSIGNDVIPTKDNEQKEKYLKGALANADAILISEYGSSTTRFALVYDIEQRRIRKFHLDNARTIVAYGGCADVPDAPTREELAAKPAIEVWHFISALSRILFFGFA